MSKKITFGAQIVALMATSCALFAGSKIEAQEVVASRVLVDYRLSGGLIGRTDHLTVLNNGGAALSSSSGATTRVRLSAEVFEQIRTSSVEATGRRTPVTQRPGRPTRSSSRSPMTVTG
ncbi:MAG: hypothetical protein M3214_02370 [Actinomycetota bacterium]|nr:hypothetical protein [Actinomycetota bacterium]